MTVFNKRFDRFVGQIDSNTRILEVGALHRPTLRRPEYNIRFADFTDTETLKKNYQKYHGYNVDEIVDIDYVISNSDYKASFGDSKFDLVLGSHVGEHMPDFIGWLFNIYDILDDGGVLSLILPDKRFTFDFIRSETTAADLISFHRTQFDKPTTQQIYYHILYHTRIDGINLWNPPEAPITIQRTHNDVDAWTFARDSYINNSYFDTHCSILTPQSLYNNLCRLEEVGLMPFELEAIYDTNENEIDFQVRLRKPASGYRGLIKEHRFVANTELNYKYSVNEDTVTISRKNQ